MPSRISPIFDGLSLVDTIGHVILGAIVATLVLAIAVSLLLRERYSRMEEDVRRSPRLRRAFSSPVLARIVRDATEARAHSRELNAQALVEDAVQSELGPLLLAERFVRAATGLVVILGLLGTFYGLTLSIGKVVHLVAADADATSDVAKTLTGGLTQALSGMAVAFSNSLLGVTSAVVLTVFGVFSNVTDRRVAFMIQVEAYLERALAEEGPPASSVDARAEGLERVVTGFGHSVERLEGAVARFESALQAFSGSTREFNEFNSHLKDNVQRMSLSFGDFSDRMKTEIDSLKANGR
jgi:methyl-accepting chemotaxis protein